MGQPFKENKEPGGSQPYDKALWDMRNKVEDICREALLGGMLSAQDAHWLQVLATGARHCKTGAFVNGYSVRFLSDAFGRDRSTVNRILRRLEDQGWIVNRAAANGQRGFLNGVVLGIDVSPVLAREEEVREHRRERSRYLIEADRWRVRLKSLKGQLRRFAERTEEQGLEIAVQAARLLANIPRRFCKLTVEEMKVIATSILEMLRLARRDSVGSAEMQHGRCTSDEPNTDTLHKESLSIKSAENGQPEKTEAQGTQTGAEFDIKLSEALKLLTPEEMEDLEAQNPRDASEIWWGMSGYAAHRFIMGGGCQETARRIFETLGLNQGTVLLLLVGEAAERGSVRNAISYARSCARKALDGQFMWGAGVRAAKVRMEGKAVI